MNEYEISIIYLEAKEFGHQYLTDIAKDDDNIVLEHLEEAIYEYLISIKRLSYYTIICSLQAKKAARRVFDMFTYVKI